jgi:hypothetical protein
MALESWLYLFRITKSKSCYFPRVWQHQSSLQLAGKEPED